MSNEFVHDFFVCHASEDKDAIARPLAEQLREKGSTVWFDEYELTLGDNLRRSIEKGLASSRFGVVVLSKAFFSKKWPQDELDGLAALERDGRKVILPIWHEVNQEYVSRFSPILAGKLAIETSKGLDQVVSAIEAAFQKVGIAEPNSPASTSLRADHGAGIDIDASGTTSISATAAVFFDNRMSLAFPGDRGTSEYLVSSEAVKRLALLLCSPTYFDTASGYRVYSDPLWWWRGFRSMPVESFSRTTEASCLINEYEFSLMRLVSYRSLRYQRSFVYVESRAFEPSGVRPFPQGYVETVIAKIGYCLEEYALYEQWPITRECFDDGAAEIDGQIIDVSRAELRVRPLSRYNCIIASKTSPFNNPHSYSESERILNGLLRDTVSFDQLAQLAENTELPRMR